MEWRRHCRIVYSLCLTQLGESKEREERGEGIYPHNQNAGHGSSTA